MPQKLAPIKLHSKQKGFFSFFFLFIYFVFLFCFLSKIAIFSKFVSNFLSLSIFFLGAPLDVSITSYCELNFSEDPLRPNKLPLGSFLSLFFSIFFFFFFSYFSCVKNDFSFLLNFSFFFLGEGVIHLDPRDENSEGNVSLSNPSGIYARCKYSAQVFPPPLFFFFFFFFFLFFFFFFFFSFFFFFFFFFLLIYFFEI